MGSATASHAAVTLGKAFSLLLDSVSFLQMGVIMALHDKIVLRIQRDNACESMYKCKMLWGCEAKMIIEETCKL